MFTLAVLIAGISAVLISADQPCHPSSYRSLDGTCNNVRHPRWGSAYSPYLFISAREGKESRGWTAVEDNPELTRWLDTVASKTTTHHPHLTALLPLWADLLARDLSLPIPSKEGLLNGATGFLDGSALYGVSVEQAASLRTSGGYVDISKCEQCRSGSGLGSLYTLLYKEHNRLVDDLSRLNRGWTDDALYEEAKKILTAEIQHVTYNEFLPIVLPHNEMAPQLQRRGFSKDYSSNNVAGTMYEGAMTSLIVLPTMTPAPLLSMGLVNSSTGDMSQMLSEIMTTSLSSPARMPNLHFNVLGGYPTASQLLEHTRSNGMSSYVDMVKECYGTELNDFDQLSFVSRENSKLLSTIYRTVNDIDLLVGGMMETAPPGALLGPTFSCLTSKQFNLLKDSDRFWYENDLPPASFSKAQLNELRKVTLSGLICENTRGLRGMQPKAFIREDPYLNAVVSCDHFAQMDLTPWTDADGSPGRDEVPDSIVTMELMKDALKRAAENVARRQRQEYVSYKNLREVDKRSPEGIAAAFTKPNKFALLMANNSLLLEYATAELMSMVKSKVRRRRQLEGDNVIGFDLPGKDIFSDIDITDLFPGNKHVEPDCPDENGPCNPRSPYRTFTGHCNNLERPNLGKSMTTFARLLPSVYEDGISSPRVTSVTGQPLPSPRLVSSMIHADISYLHSRYTLMVMQFAQFVDHDLTFTPNHRGFFSSIPDCRPCDSAIAVHPECMPIAVPQGDPFYPQRNVTTGERMCLAFMRSLPGQQSFGAREQINQNSAYLDGSMIYGEHACQARQLRGYNGKLNVSVAADRGRDLLPISTVHPECRAPSGYCFIAGDGRASEQPGLTSIHTIFMREHNRVVDGLRGINPHWGDDKLYQQARRIVIASYQHVLYNEFLPRVLGWNAVNLYGLKLQSQGYYKGYSSTCNPNIVTEFASAAYRIGHSLLRPHIPRMSSSFTPVEPAILLRDHFFNPDIIYTPHIVDEIMRGLTSTPMESLDQFITGEITNHLFEDRRIPHSGMDLPAMNVQRARDHGIPPYNEYRSLCNLKRATTWEDLSRELPGEVIARLRLIYPTVNDIDLFPGGLSERPLQGGLVGPTFACIIGLQFRQLRKCDRFWYENDDPILRFTEPQMAEIRKATLAKLVCNNLDQPGEIQRAAFDLPNDFLNPRIACGSLPNIDLNAWRETAHQGCQIAGRTVPVGESAIPTPCTSCICTAEGPQCASLRVTDCGRLLREAGRDAVLRDEVCSSQCAAFLSVDSSAALVSLTTRRPSAPIRPASRGRDFAPPGLVPPPPASKRRPSLRSFAPPDVPPFLG
ncbi:oxidoreductase activity, acting on peroxide as acceptor [Nesidiocoris tenuis]|uniref:Oxidoreductase activity, acting on peroxide as acceptor n=1 Tax=Nesidiocoris tenuis TaxID=355587 RepID=A0ABN7BF76_9HEMI|nr:oxidoreductase activity, acting on peroxide as acceptor [Nesidiocoris tenuis]